MLVQDVAASSDIAAGLDLAAGLRNVPGTELDQNLSYDKIQIIGTKFEISSN